MWRIKKVSIILYSREVAFHCETLELAAVRSGTHLLSRLGTDAFFLFLMARLVFLLLISAASVCAQLLDLNEERLPASSQRIVSLDLDCICSPTDAQVKPDALVSIKGTIAGSKDRTQRLAGYTACVKQFSHEDCVNADASLRAANNAPLADSLCSYMKPSGRNVVPLAGASPVIMRTVATCDNDADSKTFTIGTTPVNGSTTRSPGGDVGDPAPDASNTAPASEKKGGTWEGCIAVEHLEGYVLQHPRHIFRPVLCGNNFCATPNHALIVDGEWTSMRRLCTSSWKCTRSTKWVNNIKARANARAVITNRITATPYDLRFPRFAVWIIQPIEDILYSTTALLAVSVSIIVALVSTKYSSA